MSTTTPRCTIALDDDTFWAVQSVRDHFGTSAEHLASLDRTLRRAARHASVAGGVVAGAAVVAAAVLVIGEVRR